MSAAEGLRRVAMAGALALAAAATGTFGWIVARRIGYPYDLEWMEGGMLCHALRISQGLQIYVPPSVDFIPHLYTPLYPAVVAALGKISGGVGYLGARLVSLVSLLGALGVGGWWAWREGAALLPVLAALALPLAAFAFTGGFYDLARSDSLQLFLTVAGVVAAWRGRRSHGGMALAAVLLVAAFFAKQTAAPLIAATGGALVLARRPPVLTLSAVGCGLFALIVWLLDRSSHGWFWTYIFRLHQSHAFYTRRALVETPRALVLALGPGLLLLPWALWRRRTPALIYASWLALCGLLSACIAFGTQWAHVNAYIPGIFFPALAMALAAGTLVRGAAPAQAALAWALLGGSLAPHVLALRPAGHVPTPADRAAGDALIARLRAAPGEVLVPFHPFYGHLAGKRTYLHRMGIWDVRGTVAGPVRGLAEALAAQRFALIVFDQKVEQTWFDWPGVLAHYHIAERFRGPRVVEGAQTEPALALLPNSGMDMELQ